jgi:uncharacterized RDD family membrane protein YckC
MSDNGSAPADSAEGPVHYVGLVTRAVAIAIDAAIINITALLVELGVALILSLLHLPHQVKVLFVAIGGAAWILWTVAYFVAFWSATGQTPGSRAMQIRVITTEGERLKPRGAALRFAGLILAALPLGLGYVRILYDERRRGLQDLVAGTVVVDAPSASVLQLRRDAMRASAEAKRAGGRNGAPPSSLPGDVAVSARAQADVVTERDADASATTEAHT